MKNPDKIQPRKFGYKLATVGHSAAETLRAMADVVERTEDYHRMRIDPLTISIKPLDGGGVRFSAAERTE